VELPHQALFSVEQALHSIDQHTPRLFLARANLLTECLDDLIVASANPFVPFQAIHAFSNDSCAIVWS